ncbi:MAG: FAD-dependent oxidoreductase [Firmicutes bacterium]|nr:FAD-dependent oxidoreductase [Bacillota bacterium]
MSTKIVILGAGYAGIKAALTLYKKKEKDDIEITVIDKNPYHTLLTEIHEVAGNRINEDGVIVPLKDIFKYTDVKLVCNKITNIDFENQKLYSESEEYQYDYLIIAAGSHPNFYDIPGMEKHSFPLWSYENAISIREHIKDCFLKASQEKDPEKRKTLLTFIVGGGGFTGVEMIGELALWVKDLCAEYGILRNDVKLILIEALPEILNNLKPKSVTKARNYLINKLRVEVMVNAPIIEVTADTVKLENGTIIPSKTLIWTAGVKACNLADSLKISKGKACRINVDQYTQTQYENVFAAGDISIFKTEEGSLPALVEAALQTGEVAALNVLSRIRGKEMKKLEPKLHGVMVSAGSYFAVSNIMGRELPRLLSILMKYLVNIHYLFGIGGFELVFKYIKHEFLFKKQRKTLIEKHVSSITPAFWLVPIRLFLGYAWLAEGIKKINEKWLVKALLAGAPPDAGSGASITDTGEKVFRIISDHTPGWYAWIADNIIIPNALIFQILIVIAELGLGLAFISGTFTFIAAIVSLVMNLNFILSTGMYSYDWWYIPAALSMMGGAGKAFGVDHYLIPYLMRQWRYFVRNRKFKPLLFK